MSSQRKILIIYEYFYPAYKAGGIVQSLYNLVQALSGSYSIYVFTGGFDLNDSEPLAGIKLNEWNTLKLESTGCSIQVWYDDKQNITVSKLNQLIKQISPHKLYINGFMSVPFFLYPLISLRYLGFSRDTIVAPRGMLQAGALNEKPFKKKIYLSIIRLFQLTKNLGWHITSEQEKNGVQSFLSGDSRLRLIGNIPKQPVNEIKFINKQPGHLNMIYASIITPKKGLLELIEALAYCTKHISLSIYGVIKEENYWSKCSVVIKKLPPHVFVRYYGIFTPHDVQLLFQQHHTAILLSKGENFSHAIFESLGAGRPVITSEFASWDNLTIKKAGWNIPISNSYDIAAAIDDIACMAQEEWDSFCKGAHIVANEYLAAQSYEADYEQLFN